MTQPLLERTLLCKGHSFQGAIERSLARSAGDRCYRVGLAGFAKLRSSGSIIGARPRDLTPHCWDRSPPKRRAGTAPGRTCCSGFVDSNGDMSSVADSPTPSVGGRHVLPLRHAHTRSRGHRLVRVCSRQTERFSFFVDELDVVRNVVRYVLHDLQQRHCADDRMVAGTAPRFPRNSLK